MLPELSHIQGEKSHLITNRPGVSGLAGAMKDKLILFKPTVNYMINYLSEKFDKGYSIEP